ncbi:MAG: response regulator [Brachymonas sp.]|nr:response regulator [Brachymonas sp.]
MSQPHKILLVGFSSFEKVTFESFFRLAARRPPGYVLVDDPSQANLAVVNSDDAAVMRQCLVKPPAAKVLLIGNQDGGSGWPLQRRPLNLMKVLASVESLLAPPMATVPAGLTSMASTSPKVSGFQSTVIQGGMQPSALTGAASPSQTAASPARAATAFAPVSASTATPAPLSASSALSSGAASLAAVGSAYKQPTSRPQPLTNVVAGAPAQGLSSSLRRSVRTGLGKAPDSGQSTDIGAFAHSSVGKPPTSMQDNDSGLQTDHILVVDDSDIALKFMRNRLSRFGFLADLVSSGEEALGRMNVRPYKFVFLDVMMEGLDGYQTCRAIKQRKYSDGKPPVVVMLTSRGGTIDKIRGTLAGCDAYLTKPLNERDLIAVLAKHDRNVARGFQETNFGANSGSGFSRSA